MCYCNLQPPPAGSEKQQTNWYGLITPVCVYIQVLGDVCEEYSPFRTVANGGLEPRSHRKRRRHKPAATASTQTADRKGRKGGVERVNIKLCRQLDKVFIRGDNIVLISSAPQPTPQLAMVDAPQPMTPQLLDAPLPTCTSH